jgi:hypothetical protein
MHMKHNRASKTLILLIDGVFPISNLLQCKLLWRLTQSGRYSSPELPTTAAPPQNHPPSPLMRLIASRHGGLSEWQPFMDEWGRRMVHNDLLLLC